MLGIHVLRTNRSRFKLIRSLRGSKAAALSSLLHFDSEMLVRVEHVPHACLYTTGEETVHIYMKQQKSLHSIHKYRSLNTLRAFWASVREWCYHTKLGPSLSS